MMKSDIVFENFEILHRHIPPLFIQVETILKECGETGQVTKLIHSPDGQKISAFFENRIQEMSFQVNNITLSKDIIANVTNFNVKTTNILSKIDYVFQWIYQTELQLKSFESLPPLLDIEWGIRLTELSCSLFTALCKVIAFIQSRSKQISFIWFCYRSTNSKNITLSTQTSYITMLLKYLFQHPYNFLSDRLGCLLSQFSTLTFQLSTTITQILTLYSTFDWSILAPGPNSIENKSLTLPQLTILKNFTLFCETLSFFAICFPAFFSEKIQLSALISNVLSECTVMLVNKRLKLSLETLFTLSKMQLPKAIITNVTKDLEIKKEITHPARLKYLIGLFGEYIDSFTATPRLLPLFMEQILSAFGYAFFELLTCISVGIESTLVIDFLAVLSQLFLIIEKEESNIQRAFLFTLRTIDQNYMNDLIKMFGRIRMSDDKEISNAVNKFSCSLDMLDLDDFDTGTRYDFNIFYITHGRIIARIINKSTNELPYFKPILDHLQNICAHSELVDSPIEMIRRICPISMLDRLISKILEYIKNSQTSLILVLPLLRLFRMFHYTEERGNLFYQCCIGYIKRIVSPISDAISMQSRNVQVARQASFDGGFKPDAFLPFNNVINSDSYSIEANLINKTGYSLQCSKSLPLSLVYGTKAIEMRDEFKKEFLNMIHRKLIDVQYQPLIVYSSLIAVSQMLRPFFSFLGIPYSKTILEFLRQATPLLDGSILNQSRLFAGTEKLYSPKSFLKFYTEELKKFIDIEHIDARYEPLGRRFVSTSNNSYDPELFFGMQPMLYIIQTFGIQMSVYIDCLLLKEAFSQLSHLINIYEENLPKIQLSFQEYSKNNVNNSISQTFPIELIKSAASALLSFGLILALRDMLNSAVVEITESALPGFQDLVQSAVTHINRKLSDPECAFLEATAPGITNKFFVTHAESIIKNQIEPSPFFYFLGVLMSNPEWEKLSFDIEKDLFTPNLQLIALSLERIIDLSPIIFAGSTDVKIQHSILLYFSAVSSICEGMKSKSSQCYQAFIVLMDHFPSLTSNILYGHMEEAFPYSIIRGCYNELAQQYRRSKRNNSNIE